VSENGKVIANGELIDLARNPRRNIASLGEDPQGELFILAFDGRIHELVPRSRAGGSRTRGGRRPAASLGNRSRAGDMQRGKEGSERTRARTMR
jgi:hypothetical protein